MKLLLKISILQITLILLSSCASTTHDNLKNLTVGMDKANVLDIAGDPDKTFRKDSKDYWVYSHYNEDIKQESYVVLENGSVVHVIMNPSQSANKAKTFKQYKESVKNNKKEYEKQFQNLDD